MTRCSHGNPVADCLTCFGAFMQEQDPRDAEIASLRADLARVEAERDEARAEIGRLTAERDARPAITREDAAIYRHATGEGSSALWRVERALAAHAKGGE